jgi:hypothetical protein
MKAHLGWFRFVVAVAAAAGASHAAAQYAPYRPAPQAAAGYYPAAGQPGNVPAGQPVYNPQPQQQQPMGQFTYQPAQPYQAQAAQPYPAQPAQQSAGYPAQGYPTYPMVAQQPVPATPPQGAPGASEGLPPGGTVQATAPAAGMTMPGPNNGMTTMPGPANGALVMPEGYPQTGQPGASNCASPYPSTGGYAAGSYRDYGLSGYFDNEPCSDTQWFGGVYYLFMERDNASFQRVTVMADPPTDPYYPPAATTVLSTTHVDYDFRSGLEIRFGSTFTVGGGCDSDCNNYGNGYAGCNTGCDSAPVLFAWEAAFWGIDGDVDWFQVTDDNMTDTLRIYGMVNHAGLEYDDGGGAMPVNDYYDYQMPIVDDNPAVAGDRRVFSQRIRTNFRAHNVELNFLRIPVCDMGCGSGSCGTNDCGGYNACSSGYGAGCQTQSCGASAPAFSMAALCGLRYFHIKDSFENASDVYEYDGAAWNDTTFVWDIFDDIQMENHLAGFQLGMNMNYCVACKWNLFADSTFGLYNNHMTKYQRVYGPNGPAQFIQEARDATINSKKDDLSFLGEMRLGGSYDISCNWRAVLAYRAVAITGVALSSGQIASEMSNWAEASRISSDSSIIIHGVQAGVECRY